MRKKRSAVEVSLGIDESEPSAVRAEHRTGMEGIYPLVADTRRRPAAAAGVTEHHSQSHRMPSWPPIEIQRAPGRHRRSGQDDVAVPVTAREQPVTPGPAPDLGAPRADPKTYGRLHSKDEHGQIGGSRLRKPSRDAVDHVPSLLRFRMSWVIPEGDASTNPAASAAMRDATFALRMWRWMTSCWLDSAAIL